jgi:hypothetical protein
MNFKRRQCSSEKPPADTARAEQWLAADDENSARHVNHYFNLKDLFA